MSLFPFPVISGAEFSPCRLWRYRLWRHFVEYPKRMVAFVGLNPSTADETVDDPTIRRCIGFARDWGFDGLVMLNLFAFRATDPKVMKAFYDPVGRDNNVAISKTSFDSELTVCAWGVHGAYQGRAEYVIDRLLYGKCQCLGKTKDGHPKHPLYLPKNAGLVDLLEGV